jgi:hypothetical protein
MTALVALGLLGVAVALLRGGSFAGWPRIHVYWSTLALGSLAVQLLLFNPPTDHQSWAVAWGPMIWVACLVMLCTVLLRNAFGSRASRYPWLLAALGVGLNVLVVVANGGYMPQSADARSSARVASGTVVPPTGDVLRNVVVMSDETPFRFLGDVIAEPSWFPNANVISVGDLLLGLGLAWWAFGITSAKKRVRLAD